jgi:hypothetical protein
MKLWLDDERVMPSGYTHWARSSASAIEMLDLQQWQSSRFQLISFDHDLGGTTGDDTSRPVLTWMIENEMWPDEIRFHTANPVGREWLEGTAKQYAPKSTLISLDNPYEGWM